jgi:uncharacterized protein
MKFFIGIGRFKLDLAHCRSLKDKRQILKSILDRLGRNRSMSACEIGENDYWKSGLIGVASLSGTYGGAETALTGARRLIESSGVEVIDEERWVFSPEDLQVR